MLVSVKRSAMMTTTMTHGTTERLVLSFLIVAVYRHLLLDETQSAINLQSSTARLTFSRCFIVMRLELRLWRQDGHSEHLLPRARIS